MSESSTYKEGNPYGWPSELPELVDILGENDENWMKAMVYAALGKNNFSMVWPRFALWMLIDPVNGVLRLALSNKPEAAAIAGVARLYEQLIAGKTVQMAEWERAALVNTMSVTWDKSHDDWAARAAVVAKQAAWAGGITLAAQWHAWCSVDTEAARDRQRAKLLQLVQEAQ